MPRIELIYDQDCPNVAEARAQILRACTRTGVRAEWVEWERSASESPAYVRNYGSPTILMGGEDVAPMSSTDGSACCRVYSDDAGSFRRVPSEELLVSRLRSLSGEGTAPARMGRGAWWSGVMAVMAGGMSALPVLGCPLCWPAYAGLLSSLGLGFLIYSKYLFPVVTVGLALSLGSLVFRARQRRGYAPLWLGLLAAAVILGGKFVWTSSWLLYLGIASLIAASVRNAWPHKTVSQGCPACSPGSETLHQECGLK